MAIHGLVSGRRRVLWSTLVLLVWIVLMSFAIRLIVDVPNITAGTDPGPDAFDTRYARHPIPAYVHMIPGVIYLVGAPFQLWRGFRERHFTLHRRLGRLLLAAGLVAGALSIVVGVWFPYGGPIEASATVVFGTYFVLALVLAFRAIRSGDVTRHRRWMIRAFALGLAVGTVRLWLVVFQFAGVLSIDDNTGTAWFGVAFWLAFGMHALAAEVYLTLRPAAHGAALPASADT